MAKTRQVTKTTADVPKNLDKTLTLNGTAYNVNAVEASWVENKLTINKIDLEGNIDTKKSVEFNGSEGKSLDVVPAEGGKFSGPIRVPDTSDFSDEAVINYKDIKEVVLDDILNKNTIYKYAYKAENDPDNLSIPTTEGTINGISVVVGTQADVSHFSAENANTKRLTHYLYISLDTGAIFYGTSDSSEAKKLAEIAEIAEIAGSSYLLVDEQDSTKYFTWNDLNTKVNEIIQQINVNSTHIGSAQAIITELDQWVSEIIEGDISVGKADYATEAGYADTAFNLKNDTGGACTGNDLYGLCVDGHVPAIKAKQDDTGYTIKNGYYRSNFNTNEINYIHISSSYEPTNPKNGDIWIKY